MKRKVVAIDVLIYVSEMDKPSSYLQKFDRYPKMAVTWISRAFECNAEDANDSLLPTPLLFAPKPKGFYFPRLTAVQKFDHLLLY